MKRWMFIGGAALLVLLLTIGLYKAKSDAMKTRAHINTLVQEVKDERALVRTLRAEVTHLESPERVEDLAEKNLDLENGAESTRRPETSMAADLPEPR